MYGLVGGVTMRYNKMRNTGNFFLEPFPDINPAFATACKYQKLVKLTTLKDVIALTTL